MSTSTKSITLRQASPAYSFAVLHASPHFRLHQCSFSPFVAELIGDGKECEKQMLLGNRPFMASREFGQPLPATRRKRNDRRTSPLDRGQLCADINYSLCWGNDLIVFVHNKTLIILLRTDHLALSSAAVQSIYRSLKSHRPEHCTE